MRAGKSPCREWSELSFVKILLHSASSHFHPDYSPRKTTKNIEESCIRIALWRAALKLHGFIRFALDRRCLFYFIFSVGFQFFRLMEMQLMKNKEKCICTHPMSQRQFITRQKFIESRPCKTRAPKHDRINLEYHFSMASPYINLSVSLLVFPCVSNFSRKYRKLFLRSLEQKVTRKFVKKRFMQSRRKNRRILNRYPRIFDIVIKTRIDFDIKINFNYFDWA